MTDYSFPRYLRAKRSVDDRALNRPVWACFKNAVTPPARILEIGGGTGAMLQRMLAWGALAAGHYTLLDAAAENIETARRELPEWGRQQGLTVVETSNGLSFSGARGCLAVELVAGDLFDFIRASQGQPAWDVIVAHAFLDLVDIPRTLPLLRSLARPGSLFYLTINFDGLTAFEPEIEPALDDRIIALYHRTMDERMIDGLPSGTSRSGRRMFSWLPQAGFEIMAAGSSDWSVYPRQGGYPEDEAYFLNFILHFFEDSLGSHPELDGAEFARWLATRRQQVARGELVYLAHQFDFLAVMR